MTTGNLPKTSAELLKQLDSDDPSIVLKVLNKLEKVANINDLPSIIQVMARVTNPRILNDFTEFLSNIRSKQAPYIMVRFLSDPAYSMIRTELTRACWESHLDYSPHLSLFARMFISSDFVLAIEAFSVIETTFQDRRISMTVVKEISELVKNSLPDQPETKQRLTRELILVLEPFARGIQ